MPRTEGKFLMKMLLYKPGCDPTTCDVEASVEALTPVLGTDQYEWMTVRMLHFCVIHDPEAKDKGLPLNRVLGQTPIYGDFLVCGLDWDEEGNSKVLPVNLGLRRLLVETIFNKFPDEDGGESQS